MQRFAEGRGGTIGTDSEQGADTRVRLILPRVCGAAVPSAAAETEIAYTPTDGGTYSTSSMQRRPRRDRSGRERLETGSAMELMIPPGRLDRPVDHEDGPRARPCRCRDHARRVRELRVTALQGCQRADRASASPTRRPCLLSLPAHAPDGQQPRVSGCRARRAGAHARGVLVRGHQSDDKVDAAHRG